MAITPLMNLERLSIHIDSSNQILFEGKHAEASWYLTNVKYPQMDYCQIETCKTKEEYRNYLQEYLIR